MGTFQADRLRFLALADQFAPLVPFVIPLGADVPGAGAPSGVVVALLLSAPLPGRH